MFKFDISNVEGRVINATIHIYFYDNNRNNEERTYDIWNMSYSGNWTESMNCSEISALMVGFLRSIGIPSYVNIGLVHQDGRFFYHAWVSAYVGEWIDTDPALGQLIADATHIKLAKGLESQFKIFKFLNNLDLEVIEFNYK